MLNSAQKRTFEDKGFLILQDLFSPQEVAILQQELQDLRRRSADLENREEVITEPGSGDIRSIFRIHENSAIFTQARGPAGTVVIFDCNLMHGSNSNITPLPRSNAFFVYNSVKNKLREPYGDIPPRPDFIANRRNFAPVRPQEKPLLAKECA